MSCQLGRCASLLGSAGTVGTACLAGILPWTSRAIASQATNLTIDRRVIDIGGRAASVFGITHLDGTSDLILDPSQPFWIDLANKIGEDTIIHSRGQKPPRSGRRRRSQRFRSRKYAELPDARHPLDAFASWCLGTGALRRAADYAKHGVLFPSP